MNGAYTFALIETCCLLPHEEIDEAHLAELASEIERDGELRRPVIVDAGTMVILDGHHRVSALKMLGCRFIPSYLVDYADAAIRVWPRRADIPVDKESVLSTGLAGRPYPPRTSRHEWPVEPDPRPVALSVLGACEPCAYLAGAKTTEKEEIEPRRRNI